MEEVTNQTVARGQGTAEGPENTEGGWLQRRLDACGREKTMKLT